MYNIVESISKSESDIIHKVIGRMCIVDYGIVKDVSEEGIVTVEMSVSGSADDTQVTKCIFANIASSAISIKIKPVAGDKVLVISPRHFTGSMFNPDNSETIITECGNGYNYLSAIAIPVNQFQESYHKNYIDFSEGSLTLKLAPSGSSNLFTLSISNSGSMSLTSNTVIIETNTDNEITVSNGKATITVDKNGNITVDTNGKYTFKNQSTNLKDVIDGVATNLENLVTVGSETTQSTSPATQQLITTWRTSKLNNFFS